MSDEGNCATRQGGKSLPGLYCEICLNTKHQRHILMSLFFYPFLKLLVLKKHVLVMGLVRLKSKNENEETDSRMRGNYSLKGNQRNGNHHVY